MGVILLGIVLMWIQAANSLAGQFAELNVGGGDGESGSDEPDEPASGGSAPTPKAA